MPRWTPAAPHLSGADLADRAAQTRTARLDQRAPAVGNPAGDRKGQHSIRIDDQYRVAFTWTAFGAEDVEIVDYH
jgi:plasmid maintenance system killer protein